MQRISEAQLVVLLMMRDGWKMHRTFDWVTLEVHERVRDNVWKIHRNIFNALFDKNLIELDQVHDNDRRTFRLTKRATDLPLDAWKKYYVAKAANR